MKIYSWNVNGIRAVVKKGTFQEFIEQHQPDILCLQETKCPNDQFPSKPLKALGYNHIEMHGQKGYHGVAIASRHPFHASASKAFCKKEDCRHISAVVGKKRPLTIHNLYVPAGGDEPDPTINEKFAHKLQFLDELESWFANGSIPRNHHGVVVGDLNIAPLESDVWSHRELLKVVSHTPVETEGFEAMRIGGGWVDLMRRFVPPEQKLYTWWSYRSPDWATADKGRRLDHIWTSPALGDRVSDIAIARQYRGAERPSDHVPVTATLEV